jgi:hypothetical protein
MLLAHPRIWCDRVGYGSSVPWEEAAIDDIRANAAVFGLVASPGSSQWRSGRGPGSDLRCSRHRRFDCCLGHQARIGRSRGPLGHLCGTNYAPGTNPAVGVSVFGRDFTTLFRFAVMRTRPNRSTSWACARSAAGIHASHVSWGRSRFGSGRSFQQEVHGSGGFEPYVCDHDISCGRQIRHLHEVEGNWPQPGGTLGGREPGVAAAPGRAREACR